MFNWFKCKHPFWAIVVEKEQTEVQADEDFIHVDYHFICMKCNTQLTHKHARCVGGVDAFIKRGMAKHKKELEASNG